MRNGQSVRDATGVPTVAAAAIRRGCVSTVSTRRDEAMYVFRNIWTGAILVIDTEAGAERIAKFPSWVAA